MLLLFFECRRVGNNLIVNVCVANSEERDIRQNEVCNWGRLLKEKNGLNGVVLHLISLLFLVLKKMGHISIALNK